MLLLWKDSNWCPAAVAPFGRVAVCPSARARQVPKWDASWKPNIWKGVLFNFPAKLWGQGPVFLLQEFMGWLISTTALSCAYHQALSISNDTSSFRENTRPWTWDSAGEGEVLKCKALRFRIPWTKTARRTGSREWVCGHYSKCRCKSGIRICPGRQFWKSGPTVCQ